MLVPWRAQRAVYLVIEAGETPDLNPGLQGNSQARYP